MDLNLVMEYAGIIKDKIDTDANYTKQTFLCDLNAGAYDEEALDLAWEYAIKEYRKRRLKDIEFMARTLKKYYTNEVINRKAITDEEFVKIIKEYGLTKTYGL